jgi:hypothetical protein
MDSEFNDNPSLKADAHYAPQDGFLFIGELAKLTGSDPKTIRFYERAELISPPPPRPLPHLSGKRCPPAA